SLGNYIGITEPANEMFGKVMSVSDELMWRYYELLSFRPLDEVKAFKQAVADGANPRDYKVLLAKEIIARFHDEAAAEAAEQAVVQGFSKDAMPEGMPELSVASEQGHIAIGSLLREAQLVASTSEAMRMIKQSAVKIDGEKVTDTKLMVAAGTTAVFQV